MSNCYYCGPRCQPGCTEPLKKVAQAVAERVVGTEEQLASVFADNDTITFSNYSEPKAFSAEELKESLEKMKKEIGPSTWTDAHGRKYFGPKALTGIDWGKESCVSFGYWHVPPTLKAPERINPGVWTLLEPNSYGQTPIKHNPITDDRKRNEHILSDYEKALMGELHSPIDNWFLRLKDEVTRLDSRITLELENDTDGSTYVRARTVFENQPLGRQYRDRDWLVNGPTGSGYMYVQDKPEQAARSIVKYWERRRQIADDKLLKDGMWL